MSHFKCLCGYTFHDNTDQITSKARFVADQDFFDFMEEVEREGADPSIHLNPWRYLSELWQCPECYSLTIFSADGQRRTNFQPVDKENSEKITQSYLGLAWKGTISGHFYGTDYPLPDKRNQGELYWHSNKEGGYLTNLSLAELTRLYFKKVKEWEKEKILRSSLLRIEGQTNHQFTVE